MTGKLDDFHKRVAVRWSKAIHDVLGPNPPAYAGWTEINDIHSSLEHFMGRNFNHAHLPTGGGMDYQSVRMSHEPGCLEFEAGDREWDLVKPKELILHCLPASNKDSFLLLELDELSPTDRSHSVREELVDLGADGYRDRSVWDDGFVGTDYEGREVPLPAHARLVTRWLEGKILIVAKGSLWNSDPATYHGRHSNLSARRIRAEIERALST